MWFKGVLLRVWLAEVREDKEFVSSTYFIYFIFDQIISEVSSPQMSAFSFLI